MTKNYGRVLREEENYKITEDEGKVMWKAERCRGWREMTETEVGVLWEELQYMTEEEGSVLRDEENDR
jgi:hypothetical protein